jgi:hypothetical protein
MMRVLRAIVLAAVLGCGACDLTDTRDGYLTGPIQISGIVYESSETQGGTTRYGDAVAGATVSTSLDARTATTDEGGEFFLLTTVEPTPGCFEYTVSVTAPGRPTFSATGAWGEAPVVAIVLDPPSPTVPRC